MSRLRIVIPILLSSFAIPAVGETVTPHYCATYDSPRCEAARALAFAAARNAESNASIAAVNAPRAELALSKTHCKSANSTTPRCQAERAHELALSLARCKTENSTTPLCVAENARAFAAARNAEIHASMAAVARHRAQALNRTHCKTPNSATPRCEAERAREFAAARNAEINASIAAVKAERARTFAAARNAEINASLAAVQTERARAFAAARNAEINASIETVAFARSQNAQINASLDTVRVVHNREFAKARNAEINASMAAVAAERARTFAAARNAEINASMAVASAQRALRLAMVRRNRMQASARGQAPLETGAISFPDTLERAGANPATRYARHEAEPCRAAGRPMNPLQFSGADAQIDQSMKPALDRIVRIAQMCPAVLIEIHGHSDISGPVHVRRHLAKLRAQAALNYLVKAGVDAKRLAAIGHGSTDPLVTNASQAARAKNRRIEITIKDPAMEAAARRVMWDLAELLDPTYVPPLARLSP
jgi:outer membrane protein OmpA-like peptidoglycan-associated protein